MEIFGPILLSAVAGFSTILGSLVIFFKVRKKEEFIVFSLSFSMAIMICISIFDLMPNSTRNIIINYGNIGILLCILIFLIGAFTVEFLNRKIEKIPANSLYRVGVLSMISLMLHNIPEGIAVFMGAFTDINLGIKLTIAIMMHNIPEGISIAVPVYYSTNKKKRAVLYTFISGLAEPLGAILSFILLRRFISELTLSIVLIFVAGIMITLSINKIFLEAKKYNKDRYIIIGSITGILSFVLLMFLH